MTGKKVFSNLVWRFAERCGAQGVSFVVSIVLARLLAPELYGTIAIVTVFTGILSTFIDSGMGNALIQKKNADNVDFSSVFYFNVFIAIVLYIALFLAAPWIAKFYQKEELTLIVRVLGLTLVVAGIKNVQQAYVARHMIFKRFFFSTLAGTVGAAVVGIIMAYKGFGVWALVAQGLLNSTMDTLVLWCTVKWRPQRVFSFERLKTLLDYGWKFLLSGLLNVIYSDFRSLIIGKVYTAENLAFYNRGENYPRLIITNINSSVDSVLLPALSSEQDNKERVKAMTRRAIQTSSFIVWPAMLGLAACAEPLTALLLTEKWLPCVPYMRVFCFSFGLYPIHTANLQAIKAMGRSDVFLKLEIIKTVFAFGLLLCVIQYGPYAIALTAIVSGIFSAAVNARPNKELIGYSYKELMQDMLPCFALAVFMGLVVAATKLFHFNYWVQLAVEIPLGIVIYFGGAKLFKMKSLTYGIEMLKNYFSK